MWTIGLCMSLHLLCFSAISQHGLWLWTKAENPPASGWAAPTLCAANMTVLQSHPRFPDTEEGIHPGEQKRKKEPQVTVWRLLSPHTTKVESPATVEWGGFSSAFFFSSQKVWTPIFWMRQHHPPRLCLKKRVTILPRDGTWRFGNEWQYSAVLRRVPYTAGTN